MGKYGISQPVPRREDPKLLTGAGRFIDDQQPEGLLHAVVLRSPHASADILAIDTEAAAAMPGVTAIFTAADLARDGIGEIRTLTTPKVIAGTRFAAHGWPLLAREHVRFVGDAVAFVVAESLETATDAMEAIEVSYAPRPCVSDLAAASRPDAPPVWEDAPDNLCFTWEMGDRAATDAAFSRAARTVTLDLVNNRVILNAIETRGAVAWIENGRVTLATTTQMPNRMRDQLAEHVLHIPKEDVRVLVGDVGGGFGGKNVFYPEQALTAYAARRLNRPVKWISTRNEAFLTDCHGRDNVTRGELALDEDGRFLAVRVATRANLGAYNSNGSAVSPTGITTLPNAYRTPALYATVQAMFTNTVPVDAYRGAGRPEITYLMERLVDRAARELRMDPLALRRLNAIPPEDFPYRTPTGLLYEGADFDAVMSQAASLAAAGFEKRRAEAKAAGRLRGIGYCNYIERCGGGGGLSETARLALDGNGHATVFIGSQANGQGHVTAYSQIVSEATGLPLDAIHVVQGDTDLVPKGFGTGGSWSIPMGGGALSRATDKLLEKAKRIAGHVLEAAETDLEPTDDAFRVTGTDLKITLADVAHIAADPARLPDGMAPGLDESDSFAPENYTYPYGTHVCEVEVDPETGHIDLKAYTAVHDFGRALNPLLLAGQVHGGVAQGIGQALQEHTCYDADGQLLTGSYMDYQLPRAEDLPAFGFIHVETPTSSNPLGVKGCGEAGATGAPPAVINAILDALAPLGVAHIDMPATPERVWRAIRSAQKPA